MADGLALLAEVSDIDVAEAKRGVDHQLQRDVADDQIGGRSHAPVYGSLRRLVGRQGDSHPATARLHQRAFPAPARETPESSNRSPGFRMRSHDTSPPSG